MGFGVYSDKKADEAAENAKKKKAVGSEFYNTVAGIFGAGFMKTGATLYPCDVKTRDAYANMDVAGYNYGIKRYHQVSTDEVYGDLPLDRPDLFFTETTPLHTSSPYSSSKASADLFVLAYHRTYGLPVTVSRCSNNYGPYHFPEKLIPLMISRALADEELPVYGDGANVRDWLHVSDHCEAIDLILHKGRVGEIYNIGGHNERTNLEVVKTILKALDKPESLIRYVKDRPGHDRRYAIDPTKIETELGWKPKYNFDTGIRQTIDWYLNNQDWWKHILSGEYSQYFEKMYGDRL